MKQGDMIMNRYEISKEIGNGAMGKVYLAKDTNLLNRNVAVKTISKHKLSDETKKRFSQEIKIAAKLKHPNICVVHDADSKNYFIVMEYIEGNTLETLIQTEELSTFRIIDIAVQICDGMLEAHGEGVIHRDLKPNNIMLEKDRDQNKYIVKILDFGITKTKDSDLTETGIVLGTAAYMSPEQIRGEELDNGTDIFSFGIILYEMLTKTHPFKDNQQIMTLYNIQNKDIDFTGIPEALIAIAKGALQKDKGKRYQSFMTIRDKLEALKSDFTEVKKPIPAAQKKPAIKKISLFYKILIPVIVCFILIAVAVIIKNAKNHELKNKIDYLIEESLKQYPEITIIKDKNTKKSEKASIFIKTLKKKNEESRYRLEGKLSRPGELYCIDAKIISGDQIESISTKGTKKDSFLSTQIDEFSSRVYWEIFKEDPKKFKKISGMYGFKWGNFETFFSAVKLFEKEEWDKAREIFVTLDNVLLSRYYLAKDAHRLGDNIRSRKYLEDLKKKEDKLYDYWQLKVLLLEAKLTNDFTKKIEHLKRLKNDFGSDAQVYYEIGEANFHRCNIKKALGYYLDAVRLNPEYPGAINHLGYCYSYLGEHSKAIDMFEEYGTIIDQSANSFDSLGDGHFYAGKYILAEAMKIQALNEDKEGVPFAYLSLVDIYIIRAEFKKALAALDKYYALMQSISSGEDLKRREALFYTRKSFLYYAKEDKQAALDTINQSLAVFNSSELPDNTAEAHWLKGLILLALKDINNSKKELNWLDDLIGKHRFSANDFAIPYKYMIHLRTVINYKEKKTRKSLDDLKNLIRIKEKLSYWATYYNYQFFHTEFAKLLYDVDCTDDAEEQINICLAFNKNYIPALWVQAQIFEKRNEKRKSMEIYQKISELYGDVPGEENNHFRKKLNEKILALR